MWEQVKQKFGCETRGGVPQYCELIWTSVEGERALAGGLKAAPWETLVQLAARWLLHGGHSSPSSLIAFVMTQLSSSSALSLALREEDDGKRAGSVTEPKNSSASEAARKKGCHLFCRHSHQTRSCRSQRRDADHVEWRGRANALSLCGDGVARRHWAAQVLCLLFFSHRSLGERKREGRGAGSLSDRSEGRLNTRSVSIQPRWAQVQGIPARLIMMAQNLQHRKAYLDLTG